MTIDVAKVVYINLDDRPERRSHMEEVLASCPWPHMRLSATRFPSLPDEFKPRMARKLRGERAIASIWTSHRRTLELFAASPSDGHFVLLEDDVHVRPDFWAHMHEHVALAPADWQIILFTPRYRVRQGGEPGKKVFVGPPFGSGPNDLQRAIETHHCTGAHFCLFRNRQTADQVGNDLEASNQVYDVDVFYATNYRTYGISDARVRAGGFGSDHI